VVVKLTLPVVAPAAIVSEAGITNAALVGFSWTIVGEADGTPSEVTQLPLTPGVRLVGVQDSVMGLPRKMVAVNVAPPRVAVMTALCEVVIVAADAVKLAEAVLAGTVMVPGTANKDGRLLESETATPPAGAAFERVTVQVVLVLEPKVAVAHRRVERVTGATSESVTGLDEPFNVAVTVAVWSASSAPVLAVNVA
jgi:hypothetical protein